MIKSHLRDAAINAALTIVWFVTIALLVLYIIFRSGQIGHENCLSNQAPETAQYCH